MSNRSVLTPIDHHLVININLRKTDDFVLRVTAREFQFSSASCVWGRLNTKVLWLSVYLGFCFFLFFLKLNDHTHYSSFLLNTSSVFFFFVQANKIVASSGASFFAIRYHEAHTCDQNKYFHSLLFMFYGGRLPPYSCE